MGGCVMLVTLLPVILGCNCSYDVDKPVDCSEVYKSGHTVSGIYSIYPAGDVPVWVYCQMISDGNDEHKGGWTVIQRRMDGSVNFYRPENTNGNKDFCCDLLRRWRCWCCWSLFCLLYWAVIAVMM